MGLFLCSSKWGGAVLQHQKWGGAVLQISALELQQFCVKPFVGHANLIRCRYWRLEEIELCLELSLSFFVQFIKSRVQGTCLASCWNYSLISLAINAVGLHEVRVLG